jgi:N-acetylmuramoyl-L-alanine amidase
MEKENTMIILGTAHLGTTPGKCSPDRSFKEAVWSREICKELLAVIRSYGYKAEIDYEPLQPSADMKGTTVKQQQNYELTARVNYVNSLCKKHGKDNCIYISIHVDAAGADDKWHTAGGFTEYTSVGQTKSDILAECIYDRAFVNLTEYSKLMAHGKKLGCYDEKQKPYRMDTTDGDKDKEANFYVLRGTNCPAVLVECMFQDNKCDVSFLTSDEGKHAIIRTLLEGIIDYIEKA